MREVLIEMRAFAGRAVWLRAVGEGGGVEGVHLCVVFCQKGDVHAVGGLRGLPVVRCLNPEFREGATIGDGTMFAQIQHAADAQRGKHGIIKGDGLLKLIRAEGNMR